MKMGSLKCIGILPGVGDYDVSSDESDCSTDVDEEHPKFDLLGRRLKKACASNTIYLCPSYYIDYWYKVYVLVIVESTENL